MLKFLINTVCGCTKEKVKISKGMLAIFAAAAFIIGLLVGALGASLAFNKKLKLRSAAEDNFDADEYVRNLNFGDDDE